MKCSDWSKLNNITTNILELVDINKNDMHFKIGEIFEGKYTKGIVTMEIANELIEYQWNKENEGYYKANLTNGILNIQFLKSAFE